MPIVIKINKNIAEPSRPIEILNFDEIEMPDGNYPRNKHVLLTNIRCKINEDGNIIHTESRRRILHYDYYYINHACDGTPNYYVAQSFADDDEIMLHITYDVDCCEMELTSFKQHFKRIHSAIAFTRDGCYYHDEDANKGYAKHIRPNITTYDENGYNVFSQYIKFTIFTAFSEELLIISKGTEVGIVDYYQNV